MDLLQLCEAGLWDTEQLFTFVDLYRKHAHFIERVLKLFGLIEHAIDQARVETLLDPAGLLCEPFEGDVRRDLELYNGLLFILLFAMAALSRVGSFGIVWTKTFEQVSKCFDTLLSLLLCQLDQTLFEHILDA